MRRWFLSVKFRVSHKQRTEQRMRTFSLSAHSHSALYFIFPSLVGGDRGEKGLLTLMLFPIIANCLLVFVHWNLVTFFLFER